jgi:hypothetical protein
VWRVLALAVVAGCVGLHPAAPRSPTGDQCVPVGHWIDPSHRHLPAHEVVFEPAARANVGPLGEEHDATERHRWQLSVLAALLARRPTIVVGLEALPRSA